MRFRWLLLQVPTTAILRVNLPMMGEQADPNSREGVGPEFRGKADEV